jgi:hypothetical protein
MTKLLSMRHPIANRAGLLRSTLNDDRNECNVEIPMRGNSIVDALRAQADSLLVTDKTTAGEHRRTDCSKADYDIARQEDQRKSSDDRSVA